jgi:hypothetical protein
MKNDVMTSIVQMEPNVLKNLVKEVQETVAREIQVLPKLTKASFGIADLWNIQRNTRTAQQRFKR